MNIQQTLNDVPILFKPFPITFQWIHKQPIVRTTPLFLSTYLPLILLSLLFALISPVAWLRKGSFSLSTQLIIPLMIQLFPLLVAVLFDRVMHFHNPPSSTLPFVTEPIALRFHFPIVVFAPFYLIHPLLAAVIVFMIILYCIHRSILAHAVVAQISYAHSLTYYISAFILSLIPILFLLWIYNIKLTVSILRRVF